MLVAWYEETQLYKELNVRFQEFDFFTCAVDVLQSHNG